MEPLQQKFRLKKCIRIISGQNNHTQGGENEREREREGKDLHETSKDNVVR